MQFLNPIWLFSIAAVSIPVIIHLWNIKPGKTLKVGSISLIEASSRKRSRSFKLLDLLLLLVRCLFIILLAFVLAMPYLKKQPETVKSKGWLLIPKEDFKEAYQKFKRKADSLLRSGYELHYFNAGFTKVDIKKATADTANLVNKSPVSYWNLLRQLDQQLPAALHAYVITPGWQNKFTGNRPKAGLKLSWLTYTPADSIDTWTQSAWFTADKDVHVVQRTSKPSGTIYTAQTISSGADKASPYNIDVNNGKPMVRLKNGNQQPVNIDTAALTIEVFAGNNALDAGYLKAVLETIGQFSQRNVVIKPYNNGGQAKKDWLFWLSDKPLSASEAGNFKNVLVYQSGKANAVSSWISSGNVYAVSQGSSKVSLYRSISLKTYPGEAIWHDGFGDPVLSFEAKGKTNLYHFYSRFNPAWNDLVWNDSFPKMMLQLVMNDKLFVNDHVHDRRVIDNKEIKPVFIKQEGIADERHIVEKNVTPYFWLIMALIFLIERWLAYKTTAEKKIELV